MQLTPRYGRDPLITIDGPPGAILDAVVGQRRRLAATVSAFDDEQWAHPSRCAGWSNLDVISHLDSTNQFWNFSVAQGLRGAPTEFLATFDPVASPAQLVAGGAGRSTAEILDGFLASGGALLDLLASLDDDGWTALAEAPPGHIRVTALAHHALWDSWIHERDILLPLGVAPDVVDDEVLGSLRYVAALSPAFAVTRGATETGTLAVETRAPDGEFVVAVGDHVVVRPGAAAPGEPVVATLRGEAVDLVESLSFRAPLDQAIPAEGRWLFEGLAAVFDQGTTLDG